MILTILLVFAIVIAMEIVQGIFIRRNQKQYIDELEESSNTISREYSRLTDESLDNLAAEKAAEANGVFRECSKMVYALRNSTLMALDDKTLCESVINKVDEFINGEPQFDDITMVSVTYKGPEITDVAKTGI